MAFTSLKDGGLSVKLGCASDWTGGTEVVSLVHDLEWETTNQGAGAASCWMEVANPFDVSAYSYLKHGSRINISHTVDAATTYLYKGFIVNDPRRGYAGETARVYIECGGPLEVAKWREDCAFTFTDCDYDACWVVNRRNNKVYTVTADDCLEIQVEKGEKVPSNNRGGFVGYVPYIGAGWMIPKFNGVKRIEGKVSTNLGDNMRAKLLIADSYTLERDVTASAYTSIKTWGDTAGERNLKNTHFDSSGFWTPPADGKRYLALAMFCTDVTGDTKTMTEDRFVRIDDVRVYTTDDAKSVDQGMLAIANFIGLHDTYTTTGIGSVIPNLVARPWTDPVSAMNQFALQADSLVEWGWFVKRTSNQIEFRAYDMSNNWVTIRNASNTYNIDATKAGVTWEVMRHPEDDYGEVKAIRLLYGKLGRNATAFPAGTPAGVIAPADPGFASNLGPFLGASSRVMTVDFTGRNYADEHARRIAKKLARYLRNAQSASGNVTLRVATVTKANGGAAYPAAYIQGTDWVECSQDTGTGPLYVTRCHVDVNTETVELDVGMPAETLIDQLEASGSIRAVRLHPRHRRHRKPGRWR